MTETVTIHQAASLNDDEYGMPFDHAMRTLGDVSSAVPNRDEIMSTFTTMIGGGGAPGGSSVASAGPDSAGGNEGMGGAFVDALDRMKAPSPSDGSIPDLKAELAEVQKMTIASNMQVMDFKLRMSDFEIATNVGSKLGKSLNDFLKGQ